MLKFVGHSLRGAGGGGGLLVPAMAIFGRPILLLRPGPLEVLLVSDAEPAVEPSSALVAPSLRPSAYTVSFFIIGVPVLADPAPNGRGCSEHTRRASRPTLRSRAQNN